MDNIPGEKQGFRSPSPLPEGEGEEPVMGRNAKAAAEAAGKGVRDKSAGADLRGAHGETTARAKRVEADPDARTDMEDADPDSRLAGNNPGGSGGDNTGGGPRKGGSHPCRSASTAQNKGKGERPWSRGEGQGKSQGGDCKGEQPHPAKYWLFHWDSQNQKWRHKRPRTGTKWWDLVSHQFVGGGSNSEKGSHTVKNKKDKARKVRAAKRREAEDRADPAGAQRRARARALLQTKQRNLNRVREESFDFYFGGGMPQWWGVEERLRAAEEAAKGASSSWHAWAGQGWAARAGGSAWRPRGWAQTRASSAWEAGARGRAARSGDTGNAAGAAGTATGAGSAASEVAPKKRPKKNERQ